MRGGEQGEQNGAAGGGAAARCRAPQPQSGDEPGEQDHAQGRQHIGGNHVVRRRLLGHGQNLQGYGQPEPGERAQLEGRHREAPPPAPGRDRQGGGGENQLQMHDRPAGDADNVARIGGRVDHEFRTAAVGAAARENGDGEVEKRAEGGKRRRGEDHERRRRRQGVDGDSLEPAQQKQRQQEQRRRGQLGRHAQPRDRAEREREPSRGVRMHAQRRDAVPVPGPSRREHENGKCQHDGDQQGFRLDVVGILQSHHRKKRSRLHQQRQRQAAAERAHGRAGEQKRRRVQPEQDVADQTKMRFRIVENPVREFGRGRQRMRRFERDRADDLYRDSGMKGLAGKRELGDVERIEKIEIRRIDGVPFPERAARLTQRERGHDKDRRQREQRRRHGPIAAHSGQNRAGHAASPITKTPRRLCRKPRRCSRSTAAAVRSKAERGAYSPYPR